MLRWPTERNGKYLTANVEEMHGKLLHCRNMLSLQEKEFAETEKNLITRIEVFQIKLERILHTNCRFWWIVMSEWQNRSRIKRQSAWKVMKRIAKAEMAGKCQQELIRAKACWYAILFWLLRGQKWRQAFCLTVICHSDGNVLALYAKW